MNHKPLLSSPIAEMLGVDKKNQAAFTDKALAHLHEYYITGTIEEANKYTEWFNQIRHAPPTDTIKLSPIVNDSKLLPPVGVWTVSQFQCG